LSVPVRDFKVKNQVVVNQTTIFYPIFFKPYLKTYLVKNEFFKISVSFNNIESLFTLSSSESPKSLKEIDLNEIKVIGIYEEINNSNVFDKFQQTENKKIEHELFFETYTNNKKTMNSTDHFPIYYSVQPDYSQDQYMELNGLEMIESNPITSKTCYYNHFLTLWAKNLRH
jgi:hypothetical protein